MTDLEKKIAEKNGRMNDLYGDRVTQLVREQYSVSDEFALLRQRDTKQEEFARYNEYVEACKVTAYKEIFGVDKVSANAR